MLSSLQKELAKWIFLKFGNKQTTTLFDNYDQAKILTTILANTSLNFGKYRQHNIDKWNGNLKWFLGKWSAFRHLGSL